MKRSNKKSSIEYIKDNCGKIKQKLLRKNSEAESHFMKLLDQTPYYYIREKCCYDSKGNWCYIDFYIPFFRLGIEIDGKEHNTQKHKLKDLKKENFLSEERGIDIFRITNEECLKMDSVDVLGIVKEVRKSNPISYEEAVKRLNKLGSEQEEHLRQAQARASFDVRKKIFAYCKLNDKVYEFKNIYHLKKSIMMKYKDIIRSISNNDNIFASKTFIYDFDRDSLDAKINEYYEYLWNSRDFDYV